MNKLILALALVLTPFFSTAINIFDDISSQPLEQTDIFSCSGGNGFTGEATTPEGCFSVGKSGLKDAYKNDIKSIAFTEVSWNNLIGSYSLCILKDIEGTCTSWSKKETQLIATFSGPHSVFGCDANSSYSYKAAGTSGGDKCFDVNEIQLNDSCNFNDVYPTSVGQPEVCIAKSDGSMCAASAVDVGGGQSVYMPTENDCYSDVYPILDENGGVGNMPDGSDQQCTESGALSYCPANPDEVCSNGQCDAGCGDINGTFVCISPIEPPCTGDDCIIDTGPDGEECTGDDCDTGTGTGTGTGEECTGDGCDTGTGECSGDDCDTGTGPAEECTGDECTSTVAIKTEPSDGLEGFWESEYEDGVEGMFQDKIDELKSTEFYLFLEEFKPQISGGAAPMFNWCFNFGGPYMNFGCHTVIIDPRIFPALKVFFLLSSAFACRYILFGG